jgi:hypothetical protein
MTRIFLITSFLLLGSIAEASPLSRREFLRNCSLALLGSQATPSAAAEARQWPVDPTLDFATFGLDSFGKTVRDILRGEGLSGDNNFLEGLRWKLQERIWARLEAHSQTASPVKIQTPVAIFLKTDLYLYLNPTFELIPATGTEAGKSLAQLRYAEIAEEAITVSYVIGPRPTDTSVSIFDFSDFPTE